MDRRDRPVLPCLFALAALAVAPACMAQENPAAATDRPEAAPPMDAPASTEARRSAFGKVMSLLISALQQNADASTAAGAATSVDGLEFQPAAIAPDPARDIQVSAAFRLAPAVQPAPEQPATASID